MCIFFKSFDKLFEYAVTAEYEAHKCLESLENDEIKKTVGNIYGLNPSDFHLSSGGVTMDEINKFAGETVVEDRRIYYEELKKLQLNDE